MTDSRRKGRAGEQELARLLRDELGEKIFRNWQAQAAEGGADLAGLAGFAIEVKRHASATFADLERWWQQACYQARPGGYLRIRKCGIRAGDKAPMAYVELDDRPGTGGAAVEAD